MSAAEPYVLTAAIRHASRGREADVLNALGIQWNGNASHIVCPYPDHADREPSWRWDDKRRSADPEVPEALSGRAADNWRPLLAIADLAGGEWPARVRRVAEALGSGRTEQTAGILLLGDVQRIFADRGVDRLPSVDIANVLSAMEDRPWPEWHQGKPITPRQIAKLLDPFGLTPATIRTTSGTAKGYKLEHFSDAFARYLPAAVHQTVTPSQTNESAPFHASSIVTPSPDVTEENAHEANVYAGCDGVTDGEPIPQGADIRADEETWTV